MNNIQKISALADLYKFCNIDSEIEKCLKHVIHNIYDFRQAFNLYIGKHYLDLSDIHEKLTPYIKDIKERNKGLILKLSCKFDELEKEFTLLNRKIIVEYLKSKYNNEDFEENFVDDKNRIYSLDSFIYKELGNSVKIYLENSELYGDLNNLEEGFDNKDEKMIDINAEDVSFKTYEHSVMSSPIKSSNKIYDTSMARSISVNIKKGNSS